MGKLITLPNGKKVYLCYAPMDEEEARKLAKQIKSVIKPIGGKG